MPDQKELHEFKLKEYDSLRQEIKSRVEDMSKVELATLGATLGIAAWLIHEKVREPWFYFLPLFVWVIGGLALLAKGRHINRLSDYIILHHEDTYGHPLYETWDKPLQLRKAQDRIEAMLIKRAKKAGTSKRAVARTTTEDVTNPPSEKSKANQDKVLLGGWETWFDNQPFNYTLLQLGVWLIVFVFALVIAVLGLTGRFQ